MNIGKRRLFAALASLVLFFSVAGPAGAQGGETRANSRLVPLIADPGVSFLRVPPPPQARMLMQEGFADAQATIIVNWQESGTLYGYSCTPWSSQAQAAFSYAVGLWAAKIQTPVTITVNACWAVMETGVLGGAGPTGIARDFSGAPAAGTWYPMALANALAGSDLNAGTPEINAVFSSSFSWYFGTDQNTPDNQYDFVSVVMHELGHGLGFLGSMWVGSPYCPLGQGCWGDGSGFPYIYDRFTENGSNQALLNTTLFPNPSAALATQLTGNNLFFDGGNTRAANGGVPAPIYAPAGWNGGSSYSHLAESYNGTQNALMTYSLANGESIHDPGSVALGILQDSGWSLALASPGTLSLNTAGTAALIFVTSGSTTISVSRSGGTLGAVSANLGITGGCTLSANSVSFADGSVTPSPASVTVSAGTAPDQSTCTVSLTAVDPATTGNPSSFDIRVEAPDDVPNAFAFAAQNGVFPETVRTSNSVTPTGYNMPASISVANGTYSIGCGVTYVSTPGTISPGQSVCVRHTASSAFNATVTTTLTIGGVDGTFSSTTIASLGTALASGVSVNGLSGAAGSSTYFYIDVPAFATSLTVQTTSGGRADLNMYVRRDALPTSVSYTCASLTGGTTAELCSIPNPPAGRYYILLYGVSGTYTGVSLTATFVAVPPDTTPAAFGFTAQTDVPLSTVRTSNAITPTGYNAAAPVSVANGEYSIGCTATFTGSPGTINPGQTVCVRHTSSASNSTTVTTTLTIGGVNGTFSSTTVAAPNPGTLALNLASTASSILVSSGSTTLAVARTGGTLGVVTGNLGVTGGCTLSAPSVSFADGSSTPSPATVTVSAGTAAGGTSCTVTLTTPDATLGTPNSVSIAVTSPPAVGTALVNGQLVTGISGTAGGSMYYYIDVPAGASSLVVQTSGGTGPRGVVPNVNLYVRLNAVPTTGAFDCASAGATSTESCSFTNPPAGRYYVLLYALTNYSSLNLVATFVAVPPPSPGTLSLSTASASIVEGSGSANFSVLRTGGTLGAAIGNLGVTGGCALSAASVTFADGSATPSPATVTVTPGSAIAGATCTVTLTAVGASLGSPSTLTVSVTSSTPPPATGTPLVNGVAVSNLAGAAGSSAYFYLDVPSGATSLSVLLSGGARGSNANLYVRRDALPTTAVFDCASTGLASTESCGFSNPPAGRYFILVYGATAYSSVTLKATYTAPPPPSPGLLSLSASSASMAVSIGTTTFSVLRTSGTVGAATGNLAVTGGCTLSASSVNFADGSSTPSPTTVTAFAGTAAAGTICKVTLTAVGASLGSPSVLNISIISRR